VGDRLAGTCRGGLNDAWLKRRTDDLAASFHENAVICGDDGKTLARGAAACAASYAEFSARATVQEFKEQAPEIDMFGRTAVVRYAFQIRYQIDGKDASERGREVLVLVREEESPWRVAWRQVFAGAAGDKD
jgi:hypothetical protein